MKLFVYGTLRQGQAAHGLLRGARFVAAVRTPPQFTLLDMGEYPALLEDGTTSVAGEIYEIAEALLRELDRYEEAPAVYQRVLRQIAGHEVWVYLLPQRHAANHATIECGDWCTRGAERDPDRT